MGTGQTQPAVHRSTSSGMKSQNLLTQYSVRSVLTQPPSKQNLPKSLGECSEGPVIRCTGNAVEASGRHLEASGGIQEAPRGTWRHQGSQPKAPEDLSERLVVLSTPEKDSSSRGTP